jgi:uncharacterized membrane protein YdbT with pleckstrin-like domain
MFHISRWRYWYAYLAVALLVLYAMWLSDRAADIASYVAGAGALVSFIVMELVIRKEKVNIADGVEIIKGKSMVHVPFSKISQVSVSQSVLQNIFRYGTLELKTPGETIYLPGIAEANKAKKQIESKMHSVHNKHEHHSEKPHVGP